MTHTTPLTPERTPVEQGAEATASASDSAARPSVIPATTPTTSVATAPDQDAVAPAFSWTVLRHRAYLNIFIGGFGSNIGSWMESTGVRWIVALSGSAVLLAQLAAAQMIPMLALGLLGGLVADRVNRKTLLLVTQAIMMFIAAGLALAAWLDRTTPGVLIGLSLAQGITMAFNVPAWQVLTPRLVPRNELPSAIALNGLQFNLARVVGPALGGWIIKLSLEHGAFILFCINTASFVGVLWAVCLTPDAPAPPRTSENAWKQTRAAIRWVFQERGPRAVFLAIMVFAGLAGPMFTMLPLFVKDVYHRDADSFGNLLAFMGAGATAGVFLLRYVPGWYPKHHLIPLSILGGGICITLFSATELFPLACAWLFLVGLFWLWTFNVSFAAMQMLVSDSMRGRVMAICNTAAFGATPLGAFAAGYIAEWISGHEDDGPGVQFGVGSLGLMLVVAGMVMLIRRTPEIDGPRAARVRRRVGLISGITASEHRPE